MLSVVHRCRQLSYAIPCSHAPVYLSAGSNVFLFQIQTAQNYSKTINSLIKTVHAITVGLYSTEDTSKTYFIFYKISLEHIFSKSIAHVINLPCCI